VNHNFMRIELIELYLFTWYVLFISNTSSTYLYIYIYIYIYVYIYIYFNFVMIDMQCKSKKTKGSPIKSLTPCKLSSGWLPLGTCIGWDLGDIRLRNQRDGERLGKS
jgi:hypothetical protein